MISRRFMKWTISLVRLLHVVCLLEDIRLLLGLAVVLIIHNCFNPIHSNLFTWPQTQQTRPDSSSSVVREVPFIDLSSTSSSSVQDIHSDIIPESDSGVEADALDMPDADASQLYKVTRINMYLLRRRSNLASRDSEGVLEPPPFAYKQCPFSTGPLLCQRFVLLQRVYQLNYTLYGQGIADDFFKFI